MIDKEKIENEMDLLSYGQDIVKIAVSCYPEFKDLEKDSQEKLMRVITKAFYIHMTRLEEEPEAYFENLEYLNII